MRLKLLPLLLTVGLASLTAQAAVTDQMIENDAKTTGDVLSWGLGTQGQRYTSVFSSSVALGWAIAESNNGLTTFSTERPPAMPQNVRAVRYASWKCRIAGVAGSKSKPAASSQSIVLPPSLVANSTRSARHVPRLMRKTSSRCVRQSSAIPRDF